MNYENYIQLFDDILTQRYTGEPYHQQSFIDYVKLNQTRSNRWHKTATLQPELLQELQQIKSKQSWVLITEPWCGDSAHIAPFLKLMAQENELITLEIQLRDQDSEIEKYLTNGSKSIPVLVIRNAQGEDEALWGPRPQALKAYRQQMVDAGEGGTEMKLKLQQWYNLDKGQSFQGEMLEILHNINQKVHA